MILQKQPIGAHSVEVSVSNRMNPHKLLANCISVELLSAGASIFHGAD